MTNRYGLRAALLLLPLCGLAACGGGGQTAATGPAAAIVRRQASIPNPRVPPFAALPYEPFARDSVIGIAVREWRMFGQLVDDDPPDTRPPPLPSQKPERFPGMWQRVGEYWWLGMDPDLREGLWTGKHDGNGTVFPASQDGTYAWSAAFISYVMRIAGAGPRFAYAPSHSDYINASLTPGLVTQAQPPWSYAPRPGDLICTGRGRAATLRFTDLPAGSFPSHCDVVVNQQPGQLTVIGGNVDDAVTMKHVPTTTEGMLALPDGTVVDTRYSWLVVLRVLYDAETSEVAALPGAAR